MDIACPNTSDPLPGLYARFKVRQKLFRRETVEAPVFRLSDEHCVIKTDKILSPGDRLVVELALQLPFEDLLIQPLSGRVSQCRKFCSNFFCTIDFVPADKHPLSLTIPGFRRLEDILHRKLALEQRRSRSANVGPCPTPNDQNPAQIKV